MVRRSLLAGILLSTFFFLSACSDPPSSSGRDTSHPPDGAGLDVGDADAGDADAASDTFDAGEDGGPDATEDAGDAGCTPESREDLCVRLQACGTLSATELGCNEHVEVDCGACAPGYACLESKCYCVAESDAELCVYSDATCGYFTVLDRCGGVRTIDDCGTCAAEEPYCIDNLCGAEPHPPKNDACLEQEPLAPPVLFDAVGNAKLLVDLRYANTDMVFDCADFSSDGAELPDVVYRLEVETRSELSATFPSIDQSHAIVLTSACDERTSVVHCASGNVTLYAQLIRRLVEPGTYYLWLKGATRETEPFFVELSLIPVEVPANDTCETAELLELTPGTPTVLTGTTRGATNDTERPCQMTSRGGDVFFKFETTARHSLSVLLEDLSPPAFAFQPAVVVGSDCSHFPVEHPEICAAGIGRVEASAGLLEPGIHFLMIDALQETRSDFRLTLELKTPVENDSCADALPLHFSGPELMAVVASNTAAAKDDLSLSCIDGMTGFGGKDLVYSFVVPADRRYDFKAWLTAAPKAHLAIAVRASCSLGDTEEGCHAAPGPGTPVSLTVTTLPPGTHYLWVDTWGRDGAGAFELTAQLVPSSASAANATCEHATSLEPYFDPETRHAHLTGTTDGGGNDVAATCAQRDGADVFYEFTLGTASALRAAARPALASMLTPVLTLRRGSCADPVELACAASTFSAASLFERNLSPGPYQLIVDGATPEEGSFELDLSLFDAAEHGTCESALRLSDLSQPVALSLDTGMGLSLSRPSCAQQDSGREVLIRFQIPEGLGPQTLTAAVTPTGAETLWPVLSIRRGCGDGSAELACTGEKGAEAASLRLEALGPGEYTAIVDSVAAHEGSFLFELSLTATGLAPDNDRCPSDPRLASHLLDFGALETLSVQGDLSTAGDDARGSCQNQSALGGGDVIYVLEVLQRSRVEFALSIESGTMPALHLRSTCAEANSELACAPSSGRLSFPALAPGLYYLWVDAAKRDAGPFTLTATRKAVDPGPANDTCGAALPLIFATSPELARLTDVSTLTAHDDYQGRCAAPGERHNGGDLAYSFTLAAPRRVQATVTGRGFRPALYLRSNCDSSAQANEYGCGNAYQGSATASVANLPAGGPYYLIVDGLQGTAGSFDLTVYLSAPEPEQKNGCNSAATPLPLDGLGIGHLEGNTARSTDSTRSARLGRGHSKDLVYGFHLYEPRELFASLLFASMEGEALLYVRSVCDSLEPAGEAAASGLQGGPANLHVPLLPAGDYWLWVDGDPALEGPFWLDVELREPAVAAPNSLCAAAEPILFEPDGRAQLLSQSTLGAPDNRTGSCGATTGGELYYTLTLPEGGEHRVDVALRASPLTPSFRPALYLLDRNEGCYGEELACARASSGRNIDRTFWHLPGGQYVLVVDGVDASAGFFDLYVTRSAPELFGDTCADAIDVIFDASGAARFTGDTSGATDSAFSARCDRWPASSRDVVYRIDTRGRDTTDLSALLTSEAYNFTPLLSLRTSCSSSDPLSERCALGDQLKTVRFFQGALPPALYYLWIDGTQSDTIAPQGAPFTLELFLTPHAPPAGAPNALCANATPLSLATGPIALEGTTRGGDTTDYGSCAAMGGSSVYYSVTPATDMSLLLRVRRSDFSPHFLPTLYFREGCGAAGVKELACAVADKNGLAVAETPLLKGGTTYTLAVDGIGVGDGQFHLELEPYQVLADTCEDAFPLTFVDGHARLRSTTDLPGTTQGDQTCKYGRTGHGVLVTFRVPENAPYDLTVQVSPLPGSRLEPILSLRSACDDLTSELRCLTRAGAVSLMQEQIPAGRYYLWIDSATADSQGAFELEATLREPSLAVEGDSCVSAIPMPLFDSSGRSRLTGQRATYATDTTRTSCGHGARRELFYSFESPAPNRSYVLSLKAMASGINFALRRDCAIGFDEANPNDNELAGCTGIQLLGQPTQLYVYELPPGIYTIVVEVTDADRIHPFDLEVVELRPTYAHDTCDEPLELPFDARGRALVTGQALSLAQNDAQGCGGTMDGGDLFYTFSVDEPTAFNAVVTPLSGGFQPALYLREDCRDGSAENELACSFNSKSLMVDPLPKGTYFLVVDAPFFYGTEARFELSASLGPSRIVVPNDRCPNAAPLPFEDARAQLTGTLNGAHNDSSGQCGEPDPRTGTSLPGADVVYTFTLESARSFTAAVTADGSFPPSLYLQTACGSSPYLDTHIGCDFQPLLSGSNDALLTRKNLPVGTYYLWVDSAFFGAQGDFSLEVTLGDPLEEPAGASCALPQLLTVNVPYQGTTVGAEDHFGNPETILACHTPTRAFYDGPDLTFLYVAEAKGLFQVTARCLAPFDFALWVTTGSGECEQFGNCGQFSDSGGALPDGEACRESVSVNGTKGTSYYIHIDSRGDAGPFEIVVSR